MTTLILYQISVVYILKMYLHVLLVGLAQRPSSLHLLLDRVLNAKVSDHRVHAYPSMNIRKQEGRLGRGHVASPPFTAPCADSAGADGGAFKIGSIVSIVTSRVTSEQQS